MRAILSLASLPLLASCFLFDKTPEVLHLSGDTMGTTYNITVVDAPKEASVAVLAQAITAMLTTVNGQMSNWDKQSEVSLFNKSTSTDPLTVSPEFAYVMQGANQVHSLSHGKFDVTLAPLVNLWGFGPKEPGDPLPSEEDIAAALKTVGQLRMLSLTDTPPAPAATLQKTDGAVSVNLSAIAKGYGVDQLAQVLKDHGIKRYLVEIGGDLVSAGLNETDTPWSIGIEKPDAASQTVQMILPVSDLGMATSGDYRNYFEQDGIRYSHIIDPTVGRPISHHTTSVTVLAQNAMMADAWATAMLVLGVDGGLAVANENGIAAYFISRDGDNFVTQASQAFEKHRPSSK